MLKISRLFIPIIIGLILIANTNITYDSYSYSYITKGDIEIVEDNTEAQFKKAYQSNSTKVSEADVKLIGNVIYNEARGCSTLEQSCIAWTILNRCDKYNASIKEVVTAPNQFAYKSNLKLKSTKAQDLLYECEELARDVIIRYYCELDGIEEVGRTLPKEYLYYWGDGTTNHFRTQLGSYVYWDYSLSNPY